MTADSRTILEAELKDRYRIERELGRGGMAVVYLAHDLRHDRSVALKVLNADLAHALGAERFQREIHVAARLQHPHILTVLDSGEAAGQLWFTMPFVEGESLRARLARETQLPVEEAVRLAREAAEALDYAHRHGIIHRDIKPDNILLTDGHALVADFGIARALAGGRDEQLTATGASIGTAAYMSPEQAAGERDVDARSDIFSLAIVLYEMLAGVTPFAAATPQATIARRFTETATPVRQLRASVPEPIERALVRALERTAADRFSTARAFADAFGAAPTVPTALTVPTAGRVGSVIRGRPVLAALVAGLLIGGGFLFAWSRNGREGDSAAAMRARSADPGGIRIAVLPFENLGDSADAYFADGVTDAVRGKLAEIKGFEVIARGSSQEYAGTTKPPATIADELGVHYLLTGTVRWVKGADGTSRVQVRPELVEIGDGTARTRWGEPFNSPLTDVFEVQEQIAGQVSTALDVALAAPDRERLAVAPTQDVEAYNLYLQADAIITTDVASTRRKIGLFEQAVRRDSTFGMAWARLAANKALLVRLTIGGSDDGSARDALDRAIALAPDAPTTYRARITFAEFIERDLKRVRSLTDEAVRRFPNEAVLLRSLGTFEATEGNPDTALVYLRRAAILDPRSANTMFALGTGLYSAGRWDESREAYGQALRLIPGDISIIRLIAGISLSEGDLAEARRQLSVALPADARMRLLAHMAVYGDFYWVLDRAQQDTVMTLGAEYFEDDGASRALVFAQILHARGDTAGARRLAGEAAREFEQHSAGSDDPQMPALAGMAHAFLGHHAQARRWLDQAGAEAVGTDRDTRGYLHELDARARLLAGDEAGAIAALEKFAQELSRTGPGRMALNPEFARLRGNPRFDRIAVPYRQPRS